MPFRTFQLILLGALLFTAMAYQAISLPAPLGLASGVAVFLPILVRSNDILRKATILLGEAGLSLCLYRAVQNGDVVSTFILVTDGVLLAAQVFSLTFRNHFTLFVTTTVCATLMALFYPFTTVHLVLLALFMVFFIAGAFTLLLRHDIEHHHIIKHRLGLESHRVEVGRLLASKKVLDRDLGSFLFLSSGITAMSAVLIAWAVLPFFPSRGFGHNNAGPRFPSIFDLNRLGRISASGDGRVVLAARRAPPRMERLYLKGHVLGTYRRGVWYPVDPVAAAPRSESTTDATFVVYSLFHSRFGFAPWDTISARSIGQGTCTLTRAGTLLLSRPGVRCEVGVRFSKAFEDFGRAVYLSTEGIPQEVQRLGNDIGRTLDSVDLKVKAVGRYLEQLRYGETYERRGKTRDPVAAFLFESRKGPCGLFASAAVLLLRSMGVRARLVTGFSRRWSPGETVFRARDAHSWAEVFYPGAGWKVFDPTLRTRGPAPATGGKTDISKAGFGRTATRLLPPAILFTLLVVFLIRRGRGSSLREPTAANLRGSRSARAPSFTTFQASLLFSELVSAEAFSDLPRNAGESAVNYARRLEASGHPLAQKVREASELANALLFASMDQDAREQGLKTLKNILGSVATKSN